MKNLYDKFFKSLKKDAEEDNRRWKDLSCSWTGMINLAKKFILPKTMYIVNLIAIEIPAQFFTHLESTKLNFIKKEKKKPG